MQDHEIINYLNLLSVLYTDYTVSQDFGVSYTIATEPEYNVYSRRFKTAI